MNINSVNYSVNSHYKNSNNNNKKNQISFESTYHNRHNRKTYGTHTGFNATLILATITACAGMILGKPFIPKETPVVNPNSGEQITNVETPLISSSPQGDELIISNKNTSNVTIARDNIRNTSDSEIPTGTLQLPARGNIKGKYDPSDFHYGIDIEGNTGDPVYASDNGVVEKAEWDDWGLGNAVLIKHSTDDGNVYYTVYGHNDKSLVQTGDIVEKGQQIAEMGNTGFSEVPHVHFEVRFEDPFNKDILTWGDPLEFIPENFEEAQNNTVNFIELMQNNQLKAKGG